MFRGEEDAEVPARAVLPLFGAPVRDVFEMYGEIFKILSKTNLSGETPKRDIQENPSASARLSLRNVQARRSGSVTNKKVKPKPIK